MTDNLSKSEYISLFHSTATEFLIDMEDAFPSNKKLSVYNKNYQLSRNTNVHQAIQYFKNYMSQYKKAIIDEDIEVFLNIEFDDDDDIEEDNILDVLQLKKMWENSTEKAKKKNAKTIFRYLKMLLFFAEKVYT